jgi:uncharacterized membrane protein
MNWILYCIITIMFYGLHDVILKLLSDKVNATISSIIISISASVAMLIFYYLNNNAKIINIKNELKPFTHEALLLVIAGISLGFATISFIKMFNAGTSFSVGIPLVYIGIILISIMIGFFFFKEPISIKNLLGILLSMVGIFLIFQK